MKVLFVCSANICRSALCEVVLRKMLIERGVTGVDVYSFGVHDYSGEPRDETMRAYAHKEGYELTGKARYIDMDMLRDADLIVCMEHFHVVEIQKRLQYMNWNRIHLFNEICFEEKTNLPDPSGDTGYMYYYVLERIIEGCKIFSWKISKMVKQGVLYF